MPLPADVDALLSSKQAKRSCECTQVFCYPCLRHFRFLVERDGFRVSKMNAHIRAAYVVFRRDDIGIRIVADDFGLYRSGDFAIFKNSRSNEKTKEVTFDRVLKNFNSGEWPRFNSYHLRSEIRFWAKLIRAHLDEIIADVRSMRSQTIQYD